MDTRPDAARPRPRRALLLAVLATVAVAAGACSAAGAPSPSVPAAASPSPSQAAGTDPNAPVGTDLPPASFDPGRPGPGDGRIVVPKPGQLDVHALPATTLTAEVDGRHVVVTIAYVSGVEPCSILDSILVERGQGTFRMTLREGRGPGDVACIAIAEAKRTLVDLGDLEPGTYDISDGAGGAAPISVTIV